MTAFRAAHSPAFIPVIDFDGKVQCRPTEADDEPYTTMLTTESVPPSIGDLVADLIQEYRNMPNDGKGGVLELLGKLRSCLQNAIDIVDDEIDWRALDRRFP